MANCALCKGPLESVVALDMVSWLGHRTHRFRRPRASCSQAALQLPPLSSNNINININININSGITASTTTTTSSRNKCCRQGMAKPKQCVLQLHAAQPPAAVAGYHHHHRAATGPCQTAAATHQFDDAMRQRQHHPRQQLLLLQPQLLQPQQLQHDGAPAVAAAAAAAGWSPVASRRCLQRYDSLESDGSHSDSSVVFATENNANGNILTVATAATAAPATVTAPGVAAAASSVNAIVAFAAVPQRWDAISQMTSSRTRQSHQGALLPAAPAPAPATRPTVTTTAVRGWTHGSHATAYSTLSSPPPPRLSRLSTPCASHGEEFILNATRALYLCPDTSGKLALHIWRRVGAVVRVVLSIRDVGVDGDDPRVVSSTYRIYATACLWLASKLEEQRRLVAEPGALAVVAQASAEALCTAELRVLAWVEWCPLRGYLPSPPQRLGLGPARG
ncbi:hypothetical protein VOLCADRAFT_95509 [Volvox carteri f. nagariensis]|uniref:Uncharacterized protein n=1 Tax=Volvox carteri f. nagariensis TaxID=3068 RepID=D8U7N4_VOLCA|nr:uncharacterized protein VOLCADRAFT_95509 [Volvox carteri f. nagariensis]EFJ44332.1 hypothetical protein VOLCADRAFT_95509 [Volvox carteri f. nagariensis]|eukprot:XP_002954691.1 hypothetical protein VOLCADRAFT_95509 [Volvox carteri f. nagariensis]